MLIFYVRIKVTQWRQVTKTKSNMQKLNQSTVQLIASAQVISSIFTIIKELVENSLDAGALKIDVKLVEYGLAKIEVSDNGRGIPKEDIKFICLPHYTSKLTKIDDLLSLTTYGFRGEALHSLNSLASISVTTKAKDDTVASTYSFLEDGRIDEENIKPSAGMDGTTVVKEDLKHAELLLMSYSIVYPHIRFFLVNNSVNVFSKTSFKDKKDVLRHIWGSNCLNIMQYTRINESERKINVEAFLPTFSTTLEESLSPEKSFIIINNRPVVMQDIDKLIKDKIRSLGITQKICYCIIIDVSSDQLDVNVEPNKSKILFHKEKHVFNILTDILRKVYPIEEESSHQTAKEAEISINGSKEVRENLFGMKTHFHNQLQRNVASNAQANTPSKSVNRSQNFNSSSKHNASQNSIFENNWRRGNIRTNSNVLEPVQMLGPSANKRSLSPLKDNNVGKKKCLSTAGHNLSRSLPKFNSTNQQSMSAYMMYARDIRKQVIDENSSSNFMQINRIINNKWKELDDEQRDKYEERFSGTKTRKLKIQTPRSVDYDKSVKNLRTRQKKNIRVVKIHFDFEKVKKTQAAFTPESYHVIGKLRDGLWLLNYQSCIGTWNQCRGKEMELYNNLLENHQLSSKSLDLPLPLTEGLVGGQEQWLKLLSLQDKQDIGIYYCVTDPRIVRNGISIRKWQDSITNRIHAEITHVTDTISFYGVNDLKEILNTIIADDDISLAKCRPLQLVNYFKGEAVRIARQIPVEVNRSQVENSIKHAMKHSTVLTEFQCFHGFQIFLPFYDLGVGELNLDDDEFNV
uniref:HMG box domain-containing protein n=1 Tax=Strigamia maritima TaxID=126957 RepID=T1JJS1_STRMM